MKEIIILFKEINIELLEVIIVYYIVVIYQVNIKSFKFTILDGNKLSNYDELESKLISIEMCSKLDRINCISKALFIPNNTYISCHIYQLSHQYG